MADDAAERSLGPLDGFAPDQMTAATVEGRQLLVVREGANISVLGAHCPHYGAPLVEGVFVDGRIVCPWHHACFEAKRGHRLEPPALCDLPRYPCRVVDGEVRVTPTAVEDHAPAQTHRDGRTFVVCGAGAAGTSAAIELRRLGFGGRLVVVGAEEELPYDRTFLSKERLQAAALPAPFRLRDEGWWREQEVELRLGRKVERLEARGRVVRLDDGSEIGYDSALVATGGTPRRLPVPGADLRGVLTLRSHADMATLEERALEAGRIVVVGGGFIAFECAWSLRERGVEVDLVAPEPLPFLPLFGEAVGRRLAAVFDELGVRLHLDRHVERFEGGERLSAVILDDGTRLETPLALIGLGIAPATGFLVDVATDDDGGVPVDDRLRCAPGLYAAGDIARFALPLTGEPVRIEHWRLACQHGELAARNMLGADRAYDGVPFFWSAQKLALYYVGHATDFDEVAYDGEPTAGGPFIAYYGRGGRIVAALGVQRNAPMAAIEELMRRDRLPPIATVRDGGFDPVAALNG